MSAEFRRSIEPKKPEDDEDDDEEEESSKDKKSKRTLSLFGLLDEKDKERTKEAQESEADGDHADSLDQLIASILSDDEKAEVVKRYTDARQDELDSQLQAVEHDSPEEVALMADEASLKRTNELIDQGIPAEAASDAATQEVADVVTTWSDEHETDESTPDDPSESEDHSVSEESAEPAVVTNAESDDTEPEHPATEPPTASIGGGGDGGGEDPPANGGAEDYPEPPRRAAPAAPVFSETTPAAPLASRVESAPQPDSNRAGDLLLGGIVGYIIGRRGGRKRTERRLMPLQRELETQVKDLQEKIVGNETKISQLTKERARNASPESRHQLAGRIATAAGGELRSAQPVSHETMSPAESIEPTLRPVSPEALAKPSSQPHVEQAPEAPPAKLDVREMLVVADKISIANVRVGELYRTQRIDAVTLRRVVEAYSAGESFEKILREGLKPVMSQEFLSSETTQKHHVSTAADPVSPGSAMVPTSTLTSLSSPQGDAPTHGSVLGPSPQTPASRQGPVPVGTAVGIVVVLASIIAVFIFAR